MVALVHRIAWTPGPRVEIRKADLASCGPLSRNGKWEMGDGKWKGRDGRSLRDRERSIRPFDGIADDAVPGLADLRRRFGAIVGERPMLAGAGPSLFIVVPTDADGRDRAGWRDALARLGFLVTYTHTVNADEATAVT